MINKLLLIKSVRHALRTGIVFGTAAVVAVACGRKEPLTGNKKGGPDGAEKTKPAATLYSKLLGATLGREYSPHFRQNQILAKSIEGASLEVVKFDKEKGAAEVRFALVMKSDLEPIAGGGEVFYIKGGSQEESQDESQEENEKKKKSDEGDAAEDESSSTEEAQSLEPKGEGRLSKLPLLTLAPDSCGKEVENVSVKAVCAGPDCTTIVVLVSKTAAKESKDSGVSESRDIHEGKNLGRVAMIFYGGKEPKPGDYKMKWKAGFIGWRSGSLTSAEQALEARQERQDSTDLEASSTPTIAETEKCSAAPEGQIGSSLEMSVPEVTPPPPSVDPAAAATQATMEQSGPAAGMAAPEVTGAGAASGAETQDNTKKPLNSNAPAEAAPTTQSQQSPAVSADQTKI